MQHNETRTLEEKDPYSAGTYPSLLSRVPELPLSDGNPPGKTDIRTGPPDPNQQSLSLGACAFLCYGHTIPTS